MTAEASPQPPFGRDNGASEQAAAGASRVVDERVHRKMWIPRYVIRDYGTKIGSNGLALYIALAWHVTSEARCRWPSLAQLGKDIGCSRSTVVRTLPVLVRHLLIRVAPCFDPKGQHSHRIYLTDPPEQLEQPAETGTGNAGAPNLTGGRCQTDSAPLSDCQGGASNLTAPSLLEDLKTKGGGEGPVKPPPPDAPLTPEEFARAALTENWMRQLPHESAFLRSEHWAEINRSVAELLRRGWTAVQVREEMDRPERDRFEWPRQFRERFKGRPKAARKPLDAAEVAHKRNAQREEDERRASDPERIRELNKIRNKIGKPPLPVPGEEQPR